MNLLRARWATTWPILPQLACTAEAPYNLGTRCTVFMNSRVKQAFVKAPTSTIFQPAWPILVIKNALHKVLKITNTDILGENIVVQGGTFRNPAVQKALEQLIGRPVVCPDLAELMGAYGAALTARDGYRNGANGATAFLGLRKWTGLETIIAQRHSLPGLREQMRRHQTDFPQWQ